MPQDASPSAYGASTLNIFYLVNSVWVKTIIGKVQFSISNKNEISMSVRNSRVNKTYTILSSLQVRKPKGVICQVLVTGIDAISPSPNSSFNITGNILIALRFQSSKELDSLINFIDPEWDGKSAVTYNASVERFPWVQPSAPPEVIGCLVLPDIAPLSEHDIISTTAKVLSLSEFVGTVLLATISGTPSNLFALVIIREAKLVELIVTDGSSADGMEIHSSDNYLELTVLKSLGKWTDSVQSAGVREVFEKMVATAFDYCNSLVKENLFEVFDPSGSRLLLRVSEEENQVIQVPVTEHNVDVFNRKNGYGHMWNSNTIMTLLMQYAADSFESLICLLDTAAKEEALYARFAAEADVSYKTEEQKESTRGSKRSKKSRKSKLIADHVKNIAKLESKCQLHVTQEQNFVAASC